PSSRTQTLRMPIFENDRPLLDGFRAGAAAALGRVYEFYLDDVVRLVRYGFVSGAARVQGIAERSAQLDLAHDVFMKAFRPAARTSYDGLRLYRPFLLRIGKNLLIDRARTLGREVGLADIDLDESSIAEPQDEHIDEELHFARLMEQTRAFLKGCDEEMRRFVELRFEGRTSQADVAQEMGITRRRARTLEKRAQVGLRAFLEEKKMI
ncbi:MAG: sigma-70 family RNA polymerase sigma factor, partial [Myxococcota bacterium]